MKTQSTGQKGQSQINSKTTGTKSAKTPKADTPQKQQGGYSSAPEQEQISQEQENMHNERDPKQLDADKEQAKPQEADKPAGKGKTSTTQAKGGTASKPGKVQPQRQAYK